jgi:dGTPase
MNNVPTVQMEELISREYKDEGQPPDDTRTPFQHDKDRIIHSTAFRRLQYKTQVYVFHESDLYRTRLTHSLEVAQIARSIAQELRADVDLAEAIALAHDLGQAPFGHVGGRTLKKLLEKHYLDFEHNVQSYRIVTELEERYADFKGLNLTYATREGLLRHATYFDDENEIKEAIPEGLKIQTECFWIHRQPILEAQIVNVADCIAYATHDIEDALEVGLLGLEKLKELVKKYEIAFVDEAINKELGIIMDKYKSSNLNHSQETFNKIQIRTLSRLLINRLINDAVDHSKRKLEGYHYNDEKLIEEIRNSDSKAICLSTKCEGELKKLVKKIVEQQVCHEPRVMIMELKAERILNTLFSEFMKKPEALPSRTQARLVGYFKLTGKERNSKEGKTKLGSVVADYISGMTDMYAMDRYQLLTQAYEKAL